MIEVNIHSLAETPDPPEEWTSYFNLNDFENEHRDQETQKTRSKARLHSNTVILSDNRPVSPDQDWGRNKPCIC